MFMLVIIGMIAAFDGAWGVVIFCLLLGSCVGN